jgi:putative membrane protein
MLKSVVASISLNALLLYITTVITNLVGVEGGLITYAVFGAIFGILNTILKPVLKIISLPIKFATFGFTVILVNCLILYASDLAIEIMLGTGFDLVIAKELATYIKVGILFGVLNWTKNLIF